MLCIPTARLTVLQVALLLFAVPVGSATAPQPASVTLSAVKATLPVGALPATVAVNVTLATTTDGLAELAKLVLLVVLTICESVALVETLLAASPAYVATML